MPIIRKIRVTSVGSTVGSGGSNAYAGLFGGIFFAGGNYGNISISSPTIALIDPPPAGQAYVYNGSETNLNCWGGSGTYSSPSTTFTIAVAKQLEADYIATNIGGDPAYANKPLLLEVLGDSDAVLGSITFQPTDAQTIRNVFLSAPAPAAFWTDHHGTREAA